MHKRSQCKFMSANKLKFTYPPGSPKGDTVSILRMQAESPKAHLLYPVGGPRAKRIICMKPGSD